MILYVKIITNVQGSLEKLQLENQKNLEKVIELQEKLVEFKKNTK